MSGVARAVYRDARSAQTPSWRKTREISTVHRRKARRRATPLTGRRYVCKQASKPVLQYGSSAPTEPAAPTRRRRRAARVARLASRHSRRLRASPDRSGWRPSQRARESACIDRERRHERVIQAAEPYPDDEQHREPRVRGISSISAPRERHERTAGSLRRRLPARAESPIGGRDNVIGAPMTRRGARRKLRANAANTNGLTRCRWPPDERTRESTRREPRCHWLHSGGAMARGGERAQQHRGDGRLADAGIGAGDKEAPGHVAIAGRQASCVGKITSRGPRATSAA